MTVRRLPPLIPRPFQEVAISRGVDQNLLIADEPGLGKTLDGVEIARRVSEEYRRPGVTSYILVLARLTLHAQWVETILRQDVTESDKIVTVDINTRSLPPGGGVRRYWVITTYDTLIRLPGFSKINWTCVVADEVHKIRNTKAQRTKAVWDLKTIRSVGLTGTEKDKHPGELWSYLHWFDREDYRHLGPWMKRYVKYKVVYGREGQRWETPVGTLPGREAELQEMMSRWMIKRSKAEVAPDLPPLIEQSVNLSMTPDQVRLYDRIVRAKDAVIEVGDLGMDGEMGMGVILVENAMTKFIRLQQVTVDPGLLKSPGQSCKLQDLEEWLEENESEPFIVFTKFRATAAKVAARFETDLVMGGVPYGPDGPAARFKRGEVLGVVGTIASMSEGLNLQQARTAIFLDESWSSIDMRQAMDRIHRMDITEPKYIRYLRCPGTVDDDVVEALTNKWTDNQLLAHLQAKYVV